MKKLLAVFLSLVVLMSVCVGCAKNTDNPAPAEPSPSTSTEDNSVANEPTSEPGSELDSEMKIAMLTYLTGAPRETGDRQVAAAQVAVDAINAAGGVNGAKVVLELFDCGVDQQSCINAAQLAVNTEGISGLVGVFPSTNNIAISDIIAEAGIPTMCLGNSFSVRDLENPYMWMPRVCDDMTSQALARRTIERGIENPCVMWMTNAAGQSMHDVIVKTYEEAGLEIGLDIGFNVENETDYTPYVMQFLNSDCDGIIILSYSSQGNPEIISLLYQYGYDMTKVTGSTTLFSVDLTDMVGDIVDGISGISEFAPTVDRPGTQAYVEAYETAQDTFGASWMDAVTYDAVLLLAEAAKLGGANDPESINKGMELIENFTAGALTDYSYNPDHCLGTSMLVSVYDGTEITFSDVYQVR